MIDQDICGQSICGQQSTNDRRTMKRPETFCEPPAVNAREDPGLIKPFGYREERAWYSLRDLLPSYGNTYLLGVRNTFTPDGLARSFGEAYLAWIQHLRTGLKKLPQEIQK